MIGPRTGSLPIPPGEGLDRMATKRPTRRSGPDPDLEEEELVLEDKPSKSAKKKSGSTKTSAADTGRSKRPSGKDGKNGLGTSSISKKGAKDSGKRKAPGASGRRPSASDDDEDGEELSASARRRRPAPKKKDNTVVLLVSIVTCTLLLVIGIVVINKQRGSGPTQRNEPAIYERAKEHWKKGETAFKEFNRAQKADDVAGSRAAWKTAHDELTKAMDLYNDMLSGHEGDPEYDGYGEEQGKIAEMLYDLGKRGDIAGKGSSGAPSDE